MLGIVEQFDHFNKFPERHKNKLTWTLTGRGISALLYNYLDRLLATQVDLDYLDGPSFELCKYSDNKISCVSIRLEKARRRMSGYWNFNSSLLDERDFRNQPELIKRKL